MVELVPTLASGPDETCRLQHVEVLRDRLARRTDPVLGYQPCAELEQRLPVALSEFVEDCAPGVYSLAAQYPAAASGDAEQPHLAGVVDDAALPGVDAGALQDVDGLATVGHDRQHAGTHVEGAPHLGGRDIAGAL